jgi:hypothetical protein
MEHAISEEQVLSMISELHDLSNERGTLAKADIIHCLHNLTHDMHLEPTNSVEHAIFAWQEE